MKLINILQSVSESATKGETMKRAGKLALLLFALTLTTVLGGCQDKKESGKEFANNESSTETKAEPTMGGSIVVGIT